MGLSYAQVLTRQFYEWEQLGRGWHKANFPVDLEPPFYPFFGHYIEDDITDDGKVPTWLNAIIMLFQPPVTVLKKVEAEPLLLAYPSTAEESLVMYTVHLPRHFKPHAERMEQVLIMLSYRKSPISFEITANQETIALQWVCQDIDAVFLHTQLQAFFPECTITETYEDRILEFLEPAPCIYAIDFGLREEFIRPLATYSSSEPLVALFGILSRLQKDECVIIQILLSGTHNAWAESILTASCDGSGKQSFFIDAPEMPQLAKEKVARPLFGVAIRALTIADTMDEAALLLQHTSTALVHASTGASNALQPLASEHYTVEERIIDILRRQSHRVGMLLNSKELATFAHIPAISSSKLHSSTSVTKAVPNQYTGHEYVLGTNEHHGIERLVSIPTEQRLRHMHLIGATGTGKSTMLHSLIMQDVMHGNGVCVIDPHGDLIETILSGIPQERINDVVLIDPSDSEYPVSFNILSAHSDLEKELLSSDLVSLFRKFSTSWGDQMNSVFANAIMAFVYNAKHYHIGDLRRFLIEQSYRNSILETVTDKEIIYYWQKEFPILKSTSIGPILTRLDAFLRPKVIRSMVCQTQSLNFQALMDSKKIILVKLSQGLLGMENSYLLGALIVSKVQQIAMARQAQAKESRVPFFCYMDEFHHFITPSMATILSGARKYGVGLILAHQDMQQVLKYDAEVAASLLSNAGARICFRLGDTDAKRLQDGFSAFSSVDLQNLGTGEAITRINTADADFNVAVIFYTQGSNANHTSEIIACSRNSYAAPISQPTPPITSTPDAETVWDQQQAHHTPLPQPIEDVQSHAGQKQLREHRYLQTFIKKTAEAYGYKANLEVPISDNTGLVDVVLEKEGKRIAVEISVTTTAEWELHNIQKCLKEGFGNIVLCSNSATKLKQIQGLLSQHIPPEFQQRIVLVSPDTFQSVLTKQQPSKPAETVIKGYRVKVKYEEGGSNKEALLKSIITASRKS